HRRQRLVSDQPRRLRGCQVGRILHGGNLLAKCNRRLAQPRPPVHPLSAMEPSEHPAFVRVGAGPDGSLTYAVELAPEDLPPVHRRDLERAWYAAREAALAERWGVARFFRFRRPDGTFGDLALADPDACCWAGAVDGTMGLRNSYGLSVCLRLLALVDLL